MNRTIVMAAGAAAAVGLLFAARPAEACGGFFCGQQPVDQQAERIVFAVNEDGTVTMAVQISYAGKAADFAWVLPLASVPDADSLATLPQAALTALDANTGPQFQYPDDPECWDGLALDAAAEGGGSRDDVEVHIRETVGPFDVAVIESEDPGALVAWLRDNDFRVTTPMEPYIRIYTEEGMKFLALRLQPGRDVSDIEPFMFTLRARCESLTASPHASRIVSRPSALPAALPRVWCRRANSLWYSLLQRDPGGVAQRRHDHIIPDRSGSTVRPSVRPGRRR